MGKLRGQFRQNKGDRRKHDAMSKVPFIDNDGVVVRADRRMQPERRVLNVGADIIVSEHIEL